MANNKTEFIQQTTHYALSYIPYLDTTYLDINIEIVLSFLKHYSYQLYVI